MQVTRKSFISSVGAALGAASISPSQAVAGLLVERAVPGESTLADAFKTHVGSVFELAGPNGNGASLVLQEVSPGPVCARTQAFSLVFVNRSGGALREGTYRLRHATLGSRDMFLTPGRNEVTLRADFNLLSA